MAIAGQKFELDLDAENFTINPMDDAVSSGGFQIKDIRERESADLPAPPAPKASMTGFPEHKKRNTVSLFKQKQAQAQQLSSSQRTRPPSDAEIAYGLSKRQGTDVDAKQKAEISEENDRKLAAMSPDEIAEARAELMATLNPQLVERLMRRSRLNNTTAVDTSEPAVSEAIGEMQSASPVKRPESPKDIQMEEVLDHASTPQDATDGTSDPAPTQHPHSVHFPAPPRAHEPYRELDTSSQTFLADLKSTYFPELAHAPSPTSLSWLQPPTPQDREASSYSPALSSYPASSVRFSFRGELIPPTTSLDLPTHLGLHHHGDAPDSAGYTIPELTLLARSTLPNQRCIAYQTIGRILYRLGKEEFGKRGSELYEALWAEVEKEKILELVMAEANRSSGHVSARAHATEALWLWRKGCGGERGLKKTTEKVAK